MHGLKDELSVRCARLTQELESIRQAIELDGAADARDWKEIAATLGLPAFASREEIVEACRALKRSRT